jgi:hypothetical protein
MSPETLLDVYGHHHPNFQEQAARAQSKRKTKRRASPGTRKERDPEWTRKPLEKDGQGVTGRQPNA